jgi:hypothetical protein
MATKAGVKAVEMFNILGQLDALVYAALQVGWFSCASAADSG